jgi:hypothetical protein
LGVFEAASVEPGCRIVPLEGVDSLVLSDSGEEGSKSSRERFAISSAEQRGKYFGRTSLCLNCYRVISFESLEYPLLKKPIEFNCGRSRFPRKSLVDCRWCKDGKTERKALRTSHLQPRQELQEQGSMMARFCRFDSSSSLSAAVKL